jgi:hypothetical protein
MRSNEKEISHGRCRGKQAEVVSQRGRWPYRMVRCLTCHRLVKVRNEDSYSTDETQGGDGSRGDTQRA